jgi:ribosomal protein S18 acetylase RimI-like enzyme
LKDYVISPLSEAGAEDLESLARLHLAVMHTLLADMGLPFVLRYYENAKMDASVIGYYAVSTGGAMLGWAIGSPHPGLLNARLRRPPAWFVMQILRLARTNPFVLWQLIISISSSAGQMEGTDAIELTYIGVAGQARRKGLGAGLLKAFTDGSRSAGYRSVVLSVERGNAEAAGLYARAGFGVIKTFREGRFERVRMELVL